MFLVIVLAIVGGMSFVVARTIQHAIGRRQLIGMAHGAASSPRRPATGALMTSALTLAVFVPLMIAAYLAIALVRHALGQ